MVPASSTSMPAPFKSCRLFRLSTSERMVGLVCRSVRAMSTCPAPGRAARKEMRASPPVSPGGIEYIWYGTPCAEIAAPASSCAVNWEDDSEG